MRYYVLYAFLYKYMSDKLKNHLMYYLSGDEADLNMLYLTGEGTDDLRQWALKCAVPTVQQQPSQCLTTQLKRVA